MEYWWILVIVCLIAPVSMLLIGRWFAFRPPAFGSAVGYRTRMSGKNADTWAYAHALCGKIWMRCGLAMLAVTAAVLLLARGGDTEAAATAAGALVFAQSLALVLTIPFVEAGLRREFDGSGSRRERG